MSTGLDREAPRLRVDATFERVWLDDTSWVDVCRGWLDGADEVYESVAKDAAWSQGRVFRYERWVNEPRLTASSARAGALLHPALGAADRALRERYGVPLGHPGLAWYQGPHHSVAFHRDRDLRWLENTIVCLLILGAQRPFLLRTRAARYDHGAPNHGASYDIAPAGGDLLVMGGGCQVGWEHSVPKLHDRFVAGRISAQWRWTSRTGRPVEGASFSSPRTYRR